VEKQGGEGRGVIAYRVSPNSQLTPKCNGIAVMIEIGQYFKSILLQRSSEEGPLGQ